VAVADETSPVVVDLHVDLSYQVNYQGKTLALGTGEFAAKDALKGGVSLAVLPLFIPNEVAKGGPRLADLEASYARMRRDIDSVPELLPPGEVGANKISTLFAFEGAAPLAGKPELVERWIRRGVMSFGIVHSYDNALAGSAGKGPGVRAKAPGLSKDGERLVREVYRRGAIVDVSHASDQATRDVIRIAKGLSGPVLATHSGARGLVAHARNLPDDLLSAIAETGGVVGVNFHSRFLRSDRSRADLGDVVRHVQYLVRHMGIDHVAIGSDFEGDIVAPSGISGARDFPKLARALRKAGFGALEVAQIFGLNARRVLCLSAGRRAAHEASDSAQSGQFEAPAVNLLRHCWAP
jgi:membrane dipeptidase